MLSATDTKLRLGNTSAMEALRGQDSTKPSGQRIGLSLSAPQSIQCSSIPRPFPHLQFVEAGQEYWCLSLSMGGTLCRDPTQYSIRENDLSADDVSCHICAYPLVLYRYKPYINTEYSTEYGVLRMYNMRMYRLRSIQNYPGPSIPLCLRHGVLRHKHKKWWTAW